MTDQLALRNHMIAICRRMNDVGLNEGSSGNLSVRIDKGFLITPSGIAYDLMQPEEIVEMDFDGKYYGDYVPSSEWRFHHAILQARTDIDAVLHSHALHCAVLSCCRLDIPAYHYMVAAAGGDVIKCSDYAPFGTPELSEMALAALGDRNACLLGNHGVIALGKTLDKAFGLLQEVEYLAKLTIAIHNLGKGVMLNHNEMDVVLERFKSYGKQAEELAEISGSVSNLVTPPPRGGDKLK